MNQSRTKLPNLIVTSLSALLLVSFVVAYFPAWKNLVLAWSSSDEYSHGFLIVPVALFIVWGKREKLAGMAAKPSNWGLAILMISLLCYVFATFAGIHTLSSLTIVSAIAGGLIYLLGFSIFKELLFPVVLLLFMIPIPAQIYSSVTIPLQLFVSQVSVALSHLLGIPIYREGNVLHLSDRTFQVVQACSGLRSMVSLLTLGALLGYFTLRSGLLRTALFLSAVPVAVFVNVVRVSLMIFFFHYWKFDLTSDKVHTVFGALIFFLALAVILLVKGALSLWERSATQE